MNDFDNVRIARTLLRAALGLMYLAHSLWLKLVVFTLPGTAQFFESIGLPGLLAYGVFAAEAVGGALLLLGVRTREVAIALVPVLLGATWAHAGNGWVFSNAGGGFEYPLFLVVISIAVALLERPAPRSVPLASTRPV
jgi:putative oxidoreductase